MSPKFLLSHHGLSYCRPSVLLPSGSQTSKSLIVCVQWEHWIRMSTELPCGEGRTNCWFAMVPLREVFLLPYRPSVGGLWMPLTLSMSPLISPRRWESRLTLQGVWWPLRPFSQVSQYRTSATLRDGLRPWPLSGFMALTCGPLQALPSSRPSCAPQGYTLGRELKVWQHGYLVPLAFLDAARVPEEERL